MRLAIVFGLGILLTLSILVPHSNSKTVKSAEEIYDEADYLTHIDLTVEHMILPAEGKGYMSGMLIQHKGRYYILTAGHIIPEEKDVVIREIRASFKGQPGVYFASIYKVNSELDCAILTIEKIADWDFIFIGRMPKFGSAKNLKIGEPVYSLGSPLDIKFTFGSGEVKNLDVPIAFWRSTILHGADIAPGSSGGPLINKYGEVIGMNVGIDENYQNFCYAIYIDEILDWLATID